MNPKRFVICLVIYSLQYAFGSSQFLQAEPITVVNANKVQRFAQLTGHTGPVFSLAFSPNGQWLVSGGSADDHSVRVWDVSSGKQKALMSGHTKQVAAVGFNADGTKALSAGYDGTVRVWDANHGTQMSIINKTPEGTPLSMQNLFTTFSADGTKLAYSTDTGDGPYVLDITTQKQSDLTKTLGLSDGVAGAVALNGGGKLLAVVAGKESNVYLIDIESGKQMSVLKPAEKSEYSGYITFSKDASALAASNYDTSHIQMFHVQTKEAGPLLMGHKSNENGTMMINGLAMSPDGKLLVSTSYDKTIRIWDLNTGKGVAVLNASGKGPTAVVWSPDGTTIASADLDGSISLWSIR